MPWCRTMSEIFSCWPGPMIMAPPPLQRRQNLTIHTNESAGWRAPPSSWLTRSTRSKRWCSTRSIPLYGPPHWSRWSMVCFAPLAIVATDSSPQRPSICSCSTRLIIAIKVANDQARLPWNSSPERHERPRGGSCSCNRATALRLLQTPAPGHRCNGWSTTMGARSNGRWLPAKRVWNLRALQSKSADKRSRKLLNRSLWAGNSVALSA